MATRTIFLLSFVVLSLAQNTLFHGTGKVEFDGPAYNASFGPFNVHETATLSVTQTADLPLSICIVYEAYGLPHWNQYNDDNCLFYTNSTTATVPWALRDTGYLIGVYLGSADPKKGDNTTITVTLDGATCDDGYYFDGSACSKAEALKGWPADFEATFEKGQTLFWTVTVPNYVGHINVSMVDGFDVSADVAEIWARFNAVASAKYYDAKDSNGNLVVASPRPGTWVIAVHSPNGGVGKFHLGGLTCGPESGGIGCMTPVEPIGNNASLVLKREPLYFRVDAHPSYPFRVSITTGNGTGIPYFFASQGVIPTPPSANVKDSSDVLNCNGDYCDTVRTITFNVTKEEVWFVGVFPLPDTINTTFGIWYNSTCIYDCTTDNHGTCLPSGRCECEIDYEGINCAVSKGLGPQYIVLIIIASLVVASAIIGFVAWAYLRKKRAAYEIVQ